MGRGWHVRKKTACSEKTLPLVNTRDHVPRRAEQCNLHTHVIANKNKSPVEKSVSGLPALPTHVTRHTGAWAHTDTGGQPYGRLHIRPPLPLRTLRQSTLYTTLQPGVQAQFGAESATALAVLANQAIPRSNTSNRQRPVLAGIRADRAARGEVLSIRTVCYRVH